MSKSNADNTRSRLRLSASVLVVGACLGMAGAAGAQTVQLTDATSPFMVDNSPGDTVEITSGTAAVELPAGQTWILGPGNTWEGHLAVTDENWGVAPGWGANNMTIGDSPFGGANPNAALIQVDAGASLRFLGNQSLGWGPWFGMNNMIRAQGDVIFENMSANIVGTNTFAGNVTLLDGANIYMGETWGAASAISFSSHTNITLNSGSKLFLRLASGFTSTAGELTGPGTLELAQGTLVLDGADTAASPFTGTLQIDTGATVIVGDSTHSTAVFGDPGHPTASILAIQGSINGSSRLLGYGTVAANVSNAGGYVQPGGTSGTPGTLTIAGNYTQSSTGTLRVGVTPTGADQLHVKGTASLAGSLNVTIGPGNYGTQIYNIVTVDGTMTGGFSNITTTSGATGAIAAVTKSSSGYQVVTEVISGANATAPVAVGHLVSANRLNLYEFAGSLYDVISTNTPGATAEVGHNINAWLEPFGRISSITRDSVGYHTSAEGVTGGVEYRLPEKNMVLGFAASYAHQALKAKGASDADSDTYDMALYGGADVQYARLDGMLFYNTYDATANRDFGNNGIAKVKPSGFGFGGSVQLSKSLFKGLVTPFMRGIYSRQHLDGSVEAGATVLDLKYDAINANTFVGDVGLKINPFYVDPGCPTKLLISVAIEHDFSKLGEIVTGEFPIGSGQEFTTFWKGDSENTLLVGLDAAHNLTDSIEIYGRVDGRFSLYQTAGAISIGGRYRF